MAVGLKNWSTTAGSNGTADSNIGMAEGQTPASLNNGVRALMAALAAWYDLIGGVATQGGSVNAYTITNAAPNTWAGYGDGDIVMLVPNATNTSTSVTVAVDGLAVKRVKKSDETDPAVGVLVAGGFYLLVYSATTGHFQIINSATGTGAYQPLDATLTALAALSWSAGRQAIVFTAADTVSLITTTAASESVLDDTTVGAMCTTLGALNLNTTTNTYSVAALQIVANTSDGSDSSEIRVCGGGAQAASRGGTVICYGNEHANVGQVLVRAGAGVAGGISLDSGGGIVAVTGSMQAAVALSSETSGTLTSASANKHLALTGNITLNNSVFAANDKITLDPGTSNRTITRGSNGGAAVMYKNGTDSSSATLAANQMGGVHVRTAGASSVFVLSGAVS